MDMYRLLKTRFDEFVLRCEHYQKEKLTRLFTHNITAPVASFILNSVFRVPLW